MKNIYKIISLFLCVCLLIVFAAGCASFDTETSESTLESILEGNKTDGVTSSYENPFHNPVDYPKEHYPVGNKMFAKLEITKVYDEAYFLVSDIEFKNPFLLAEVTVLEDFYKYTEANTSFTVMLALESAEEFFQKTKDVFTQADALYAYCSLRGGENYLNVEMVTKNEDEKIKLGVFSDDIKVDWLHLISCADGVVRFGSLICEENEYATHLRDFIYEGQPCEELEENIKELYEKMK